jgi:hypothetical protein
MPRKTLQQFKCHSSLTPISRDRVRASASETPPTALFDWGKNPNRFRAVFALRGFLFAAPVCYHAARR